MRKRLLYVDMLAHFHSHHCLHSMHVIRSRNCYGVDIFFFFFKQHAVILVIGCLGMILSSFCRTGIVYITEGYDVYFAAFMNSSKVTISHSPDADGCYS